MPGGDSSAWIRSGSPLVHLLPSVYSPRMKFVRDELGGSTDCLVGDSPAMKKLRHTLARIAPYPRPILVRGERGVGKELVAQLLNALSPRAARPFITVNCGAVPHGVMGSEIFGHEKGAFTSATGLRAGKLEMADGGTLFLDEIGNMPLELQKMLVRVIEYQRFERVGGSRPIEVDVRIIAATNADLDERVRRGEFLADLYDRIRYAEIRVPLLGERREDIPDLSRHFLERLISEMPWLQVRRISDAALVELSLRPWPGNVRELRAAIETAAVLCDSSEIQTCDLPPRRGEPSCGPVDGGFHEQVCAFERRVLVEAIRSSRNGRSAAQKLLLSYDQFRRLVRKHELALNE